MCEFCNGAKPLTIGKTDDYGIAIKYPHTLIAFGYCVSGFESNAIYAEINYCPMCGAKMDEVSE